MAAERTGAADGSTAIERSSAGVDVVHFLHVGKTGGSALKAALQPAIETRRIVFHPHSTRLSDLPPDARACLTLRHPVARFVSAFNSRLRKGAPKNNAPWNEGETIAFSHFATPNALAEALSSPGDETVRQAEFAMKAIRHVNQPMTYWVQSVSEIVRRGNVIVLFQKRLMDDFELLKKEYNLPRNFSLPSDPVSAHVTPPGFSTCLSQDAIRNLVQWYITDINLYKEAKETFWSR